MEFGSGEDKMLGDVRFKPVKRESKSHMFKDNLIHGHDTIGEFAIDTCSLLRPSSYPILLMSYLPKSIRGIGALIVR